MQLQFTAESELVLRLFSDIMPCSVAGENIIKNHHSNNLKTLSSLWGFIRHFGWNTIKCFLSCILFLYTPTK
jgi:hypothetical protein